MKLAPRRIRTVAVLVCMLAAAALAWRHWVAWPPLHRAILKGQEQKVAALIAQTVDVNERVSMLGTDYYSGWTPLMLAAFRNEPVIVDLLLDAGADPGLADARGRTAIVIASQGGCTACIARIVTAGGAVDARWGAQRSSALHDAVLMQDVGTVAALLEAGAEVDAEDGYGATPLQYSVRHQPNAAVIRVLLDYGANPHHRNRAGASAFDIASKATNMPQEITALFENGGLSEPEGDE